MRVLINTSVQRFGGGIQVALSFIHECIHFPENEYHVLVGSGVGKSLNKKKFPGNFFFHEVSFGTVNLLKTFIIARKLRLLEAQIKPDCVITTSGPSYWKPAAPHAMGFNLPLYLYPESPYLIRMNIFRRVRLLIRKHLHLFYFKRDASAYLVQTDDVNVRVRKLLNAQKVYTVTNNHSSYYTGWQKFPSRLPPRINGVMRFLAITAWYPHKNLEILPDVVDELKKRGFGQVQFILTIGKDRYQNLFGDRYTDTIITTGPIKPEECPSLYDECDFLFHPTLAECFSAAYPEAMIMKKPIITTDLGFARSICGDAALYFEPMNAVSAADVVVNLLTNKDIQLDLIQKGLNRLKHFDSPVERAGKYLEICRNLVSTPLLQN